MSATHSPAAYSIRRARFSDAPALARIMVDTFLAANREILPPAVLRHRTETWTYAVSQGNWEETLAEIDSGETPQVCIYVAVDAQGTPVGLGLGRPLDPARPTVGELHLLYVREEVQGQGIGRRLFAAVAAHLADQGMTALQLDTPAASTAARAFYERLGGQMIGTRDELEDGIIIPLVVYSWPDTRRVSWEKPG